MAKYESILCPCKKDHKHDKVLLFVGKEELYAFCKEHYWIKIILKKGNKKINFENAAVVIEPVPDGYVFENEPMPILALGNFSLRQRIREKRNAKSK